MLEKTFRWQVFVTFNMPLSRAYSNTCQQLFLICCMNLISLFFFLCHP